MHHNVLPRPAITAAANPFIEAVILA